MTMREVGNAVSGFFKFREMDFKATWEAARLTGYCSLTPHVKKGKKFTLQDVIRFSWEKKAAKDREKVVSRGKELAQKWRKSIRE